MRDTLVRDRMGSIAAMFAEGYWRKSLALAAATKAEMLASGRADAELLGWVRYYEFRNLLALEDWKAIDDLYRAREPLAYAMPLKNAAWVCSVAGEAAARLGDAEQVVRRLRRCYRMRMKDRDLESAFHALQTGCVLLKRIGRADLNTGFADRLIEVGIRLHLPEAVLRGYTVLMDNYEASPRTTVRRRLKTGRERLPDVDLAAAERLLSRLRKLVD